MSKFSWGNGFATGLVIGIILVIFAFLGLAASNEFEQPAQSGSNAEISGGTESHKSQYEESAFMYWARRTIAIEDSSAQWLMAFFSLAATVLLWQTLHAVNKTNAAALDANELMRRDQRPWLDFTIEDFGRWQALLHEGQVRGGVCFPKVKITNEGRSPAIDARFQMNILAGTSLESDEVPEIVKEAAAKKPEGRMVFPGQEFTWENWGAGHAARQARQGGPNNPNSIMSWYLICFVTYRFEESILSTVKVFSYSAPDVGDLEDDERGHPRWFTPEAIHHIPLLDSYT